MSFSPLRSTLRAVLLAGASACVASPTRAAPTVSYGPGPTSSAPAGRGTSPEGAAAPRQNPTLNGRVAPGFRTAIGRDEVARPPLPANVFERADARRRFGQPIGGYEADPGFATVDDTALAGPFGPSNFGFPPPGAFGPPPLAPAITTPPRCPLIIKVGRGLANSVRTRVVYGRPACF